MAAADSEKLRLDEAARAGWLYFIAGHTQDEIAKMLQISRASAQRLVSLCLAERLITFRLEHPIAACMELAARLKEAFKLAFCEVVPSDPAAPQTVAGIAERAANLLELMLRSDKPMVVALGTGRAVRAAVERVSPIDRPNHQIVSLVGNISADGSASFFDTVGRLADLTRARHYPMPLPFLMSSEKERAQMLRLEPISKVRAIAAKADLRLVGIGQMDQHAQVLVDGFVTRQELFDMMRRRIDRMGLRRRRPHHRRWDQPSPDQHSAPRTGGGPHHRRGGRQGQGIGHPGGVERPPDQRLDHR
jgi:DNA-binding transcriptional regulator LsrR (DeoR family)